MDTAHSTLALIQKKADEGDLPGALVAVTEWLADQPRHISAWQLMARVLSRMDRMAEAEEALAQALMCEPRNPAVHYQLGNIHFRKGDFTKAHEHFETAHKGRPLSPEILNDLGSTRLALGNVDGAVSALREATRVDPEFAMAHANLGAALAYRGEIGTPLKAFLKATKLEPNNHRIWLKMGRTLLNQGHLDTAERCLRRVLKSRPQNLQAQSTLGTLLERSGRYPEALTLLEPLLAAGVRESNTMVAWATTLRRIGRSKEAVPILEAHLQGPRSQPERVLLGHTLGDLYEKEGLHQQAFRAHEQANLDHGLQFSPTRYAASVEQIIEAFPASSYGRRSKPPASDATPVFIVGMPRSGTSLVEQIIDSHPQAAGAGELETLRQLARSLTQAQGPTDWTGIMDSLSISQAEKLSRSYLHTLRRTDALALRITDKMPTNFINLGLAGQVLPGARVIHCTRDPYDTALSCYFKHFNFGYAFSNQLDWLGHFTVGYRRLMDHWETSLPLPMLTIRYEDLVEDLESGTRQILNFLQLPWDDACMRFHENKRPVKTASYAQVRRPIYRSSVGRSEPYREWLGPLEQTLRGGITTNSG
jgi:tetratricopeptide (TPR) repeat protein